MEKQRTLQIIRRLSAPLLAIPAALLLHAIARFVWVWHPAWMLFRDNNNNTSPLCQVPSWGLWDCPPEVPRDFWNYNTDLVGVIMSHLLAVLLVGGVIAAALLVASLVQGVRMFLQWAFEKPYEQANDAEDAEEDLFISSCTNPQCPCPDHQEYDRFDWERNCWVEREDEDEAAAQPSPYATN